MEGRRSEAERKREGMSEGENSDGEEKDEGEEKGEGEEKREGEEESEGEEKIKGEEESEEEKSARAREGKRTGKSEGENEVTKKSWSSLLTDLVRMDEGILNIKPLVNTTLNYFGLLDEEEEEEKPASDGTIDNKLILKSIFHMWNPKVFFRVLITSSFVGLLATPDGRRPLPHR